MADSEHTGQERNLDPTAKRLDDARREGQVARSRDLAHLLLLSAAGGALVLLSGPLLRACHDLLVSGLRFDQIAATDASLLTERLSNLTAAALLATVPILGVLLLAAVAAPLVMGGFIFVPTLAQPKFSRLSPKAGLGRMFSLPSLVDLGKVILVALLLAAIGGAFLMTHVEEFAGLAHESLPQGLAHFGRLFLFAFFAMVSVLAATSAIDVPFQLFHHHKQLKMTLEEVRREERETQGDPHIKARIRSVQREMARRRMMAAVPTADVVVTNPTHYAIALKYADGQRAAPVVIAKGADEIAAHIRELAAEHDVPLVSAPPLARALYRHVELGAEIPAPLYTAVAQVLAYVFQLRRWNEGRAPQPVMPDEIVIPESLDPGVA